jgi:hypothetical protein
MIFALNIIKYNATAKAVAQGLLPGDTQLTIN